jgi:hypothetical protein
MLPALDHLAASATSPVPLLTQRETTNRRQRMTMLGKLPARRARTGRLERGKAAIRAKFRTNTGYWLRGLYRDNRPLQRQPTEWNRGFGPNPADRHR